MHGAIRSSGQTRIRGPQASAAPPGVRVRRYERRLPVRGHRAVRKAPDHERRGGPGDPGAVVVRERHHARSRSAAAHRTAPAANRDPDVFHEPDAFDYTRSPEESRNLSFGLGTHSCADQLISRAETEAVHTGRPAFRPRRAGWPADARRQRLHPLLLVASPAAVVKQKKKQQKKKRKPEK